MSPREDLLDGLAGNEGHHHFGRGWVGEGEGGGGCKSAMWLFGDHGLWQQKSGLGLWIIFGGPLFSPTNWAEPPNGGPSSLAGATLCPVCPLAPFELRNIIALHLISPRTRSYWCSACKSYRALGGGMQLRTTVLPLSVLPLLGGVDV